MLHLILLIHDNIFHPLHSALMKEHPIKRLLISTPKILTYEFHFCPIKSAMDIYLSSPKPHDGESPASPTRPSKLRQFGEIEDGLSSTTHIHLMTFLWLHKCIHSPCRSAKCIK